MKDKIRFLAASDFHSDMNLIRAMDIYTDWDDIDFIILTGDLSEKEDDFDKIFKAFGGKQVFMVPGNHETKTSVEALKKNYNVHLVGNSPVRIGDQLALFGSNYIPVGPHSVSEQDIFENMVQNFSAIKDVPFKIHLSHLPPADTKVGDASPYHPFIGGSQAVKFFLEHFEPDVTFVGHIHESSGLEEIVNKTKVVNIARTFKVFEFDRNKNKLTELKTKAKKKPKSKQTIKVQKPKKTKKKTS